MRDYADGLLGGVASAEDLEAVLFVKGLRGEMGVEFETNPWQALHNPARKLAISHHHHPRVQLLNVNVVSQHQLDARILFHLVDVVIEHVRLRVRNQDVVVDPNSGKQVGRGAVNGDPCVLTPGNYLVQISGLKSDPVAVELSSGQLLELNLDGDGNLRAPVRPVTK